MREQEAVISGAQKLDLYSIFKHGKWYSSFNFFGSIFVSFSINSLEKKTPKI